MALSNGRTIPLYQSEHEIFGIDHSLVGAMLVEKWQFPAELVDCVRHHHDEQAGDSTMGACLFVADQISKRLLPGGMEYPLPPLPPAIAERFGDSYEAIIGGLGDISGLAEEARFFAQVGAEP
jgi:hypothetical protein